MLGQIVRLALHTGMRAGEIRTLRRSQVNLEKRLVMLTETKNGCARTEPLSNAAVTVLRTALANPVWPIDTDLVFFGEPGCDKVRWPYEFRPQWHRTLAALGIKGLRFHDLRHEAVSRPGSAIRRSLRSPGTSPCRCYAVTRTCAPRTWCAGSISSGCVSRVAISETSSSLDRVNYRPVSRKEVFSYLHIDSQTRKDHVSQNNSRAGRSRKPAHRALWTVAHPITTRRAARPQRWRFAVQSLRAERRPCTRALKACGRRIGRRVYYPAIEVARIITSAEDE